MHLDRSIKSGRKYVLKLWPEIHTSTEIIHRNGTAHAGPPLKPGLTGHCMVTLDDGRIMIIGILV